MNQESIARLQQVGQVFTPGSPVSERELFAGRIEQLSKIIDATGQRGYHAILYGERGVGKTSLANVLAGIWQNSNFLVTRVTCDATDTFVTLWRKAFKDITVHQSRPGLGFGAEQITTTASLLDSLPQVITPDDVRRVLQQVAMGPGVLLIFDEFDRITDKTETILMADTVKALSDYAVNATILLIGVADSVSELVQGHHSVERAIFQIPMPRMSSEEIAEILENGFKRLAIRVKASARDELISLSQGLPYITHLLGLHVVRATIRMDKDLVSEHELEVGMKTALDQWQQSIKTDYYAATSSPQPGNIFKEVLLACALAEKDELGFFSASSVRAPLRMITEREYDIPNFARHLKEFSEHGRGLVLQREGESRRIRYRFTNPLMQPYALIRGFSEGLLKKNQVKKL